MKIAYFVMVHNNFAQFRWLWRALYNLEDRFMLHIDKKSDPTFNKLITDYVGTRPNVTFLPSRPMVRFGWSIVGTELRAISELIKLDDSWRYIINLSAQDYPIKSMGTIKALLAKEWPNNFIEVSRFSAVADKDPDDPHLPRRLAFEWFGSMVVTSRTLPFPRHFDVKHKGSAWFMLTRDFCEWLLHSWTTWKAKKLVQYTWNPDELFFQALAMNSGYKDSLAKHYGRYIVWEGSASPKTLVIDDYDQLSSSPALFARKFDEAINRDILEFLARDCGYEMPMP